MFQETVEVKGHIIDSLIRKPGAFENYRYRSDLFPTSRFRVAYDCLRKSRTVTAAAKEYLSILQLAARDNETAVDDALRHLIDHEKNIDFAQVESVLLSGKPVEPITDISVQAVALTGYDLLLQEGCR